ncbi:hypothetical protein Bbelb_347540 [Branchiostoma belcheri]|nr:hypothetical protein Bbelb_347540 [Branchiostoma belcheri]
MFAAIFSRVVGLALVFGLASANLVRLTPRTEYVYDYTAQSRLGDIALLVTKAKVNPVIEVKELAVLKDAGKALAPGQFRSRKWSTPFQTVVAISEQPNYPRHVQVFRTHLNADGSYGERDMDLCKIVLLRNLTGGLHGDCNLVFDFMREMYSRPDGYPPISSEALYSHPFVVQLQDAHWQGLHHATSDRTPPARANNSTLPKPISHSAEFCRHSLP